MTNVLFSLPVEIWRDHILQFFNLLDIAKASNSFLNEKVQKQFDLLTHGCMLRATVKVQTNQVKMIDWCLKRSILATNVCIDGDLDQHTVSILPGFVSKVTYLSVETSNTKYFEATLYPSLVCFSLNVSSTTSLGSLSACTSLTTLELHYCQNICTDSLLKSLSGCNNLEGCIIRGCTQITERAISGILVKRPRLAVLEFGGVREHPKDLGAILDIIPTNMVLFSMRTVVMSMFTTVCGTGARGLAVLCPLLQKLHLDDATADSTRSDTDVGFVCLKCPHLVDLTQRNFQLLTNAALVSIAQHLPKIEKLVLSLGSIGDEGVIAVAQGCMKLTKLHIHHSQGITNVAVQQVWLHCSKLADLSLIGCTQITDAAFVLYVNTSV